MIRWWFYPPLFSLSFNILFLHENFINQVMLSAVFDFWHEVQYIGSILMYQFFMKNKVRIFLASFFIWNMSLYMSWIQLQPILTVLSVYSLWLHQKTTSSMILTFPFSTYHHCNVFFHFFFHMKSSFWNIYLYDVVGM